MNDFLWIAEQPDLTPQNGGAHKPRQRKQKERSSKKQHKNKGKATAEGDQPQYKSYGAYQYV